MHRNSVLVATLKNNGCCDGKIPYYMGQDQDLFFLWVGTYKTTFLDST